MTDVILVLNSGSSSIKFSIFAVHEPGRGLALHYQGHIEGIGSDPRFFVADADGRRVIDERIGGASAGGGDHESLLPLLHRWIEAHADGLRVVAVGHRVVHGGEEFAGPVLVDAAIVDQLDKLSPLVPRHQTHNLAAIRAVARIAPGLPQVACFDTAFHRTQARVAQLYGLPRELSAAGIKRYGLHGLSYEYVATVLPGLLGDRETGRVVAAHLGNGCSMCAMCDGKSVASTMGFTVVEGLDQSGLLGVSGISNDMRKLLASKSPEAAEAVSLFVYRIGRELGSLAAALGGLDVLVFTGRIGEHATSVRARVCADARWLGIRLDPVANLAGGPRISTGDSAVSVWVVPTNEEPMIAKHTAACGLHAVLGAV